MEACCSGTADLTGLRRAARKAVIGYLWTALASLPCRLARCRSAPSQSGRHCFCRQ